MSFLLKIVYLVFICFRLYESKPIASNKCNYPTIDKLKQLYSDKLVLFKKMTDDEIKKNSSLTNRQFLFRNIDTNLLIENNDIDKNENCQYTLVEKERSTFDSDNRYPFVIKHAVLLNSRITDNRRCVPISVKMPALKRGECKNGYFEYLFIIEDIVIGFKLE